MVLHQGQELDDDLGRGADEDLTLATLLRVNDGLEAVVLKQKIKHTNRTNEKSDVRVLKCAF